MADDPNRQRRDHPSAPVGPVDPLVVPRFAGPSTFARLPRREDVDGCDVAVLGIPFDSGVTYRPGARFGPHAVRNATRLLRAYHAASGGPSVRGAAGRRRRRRGLQPVRHRRGDHADRGRRGRDAGLVEPSPVDRRRPHDRAPAAPGDASPPRSDRAPALRRAPRHVGHVFRRGVHARDPVPPRVGGGPPARGPRHPRGDPGPAVLAGGPRGRRALRIRDRLGDGRARRRPPGGRDPDPEPAR